MNYGLDIVENKFIILITTILSCYANIYRNDKFFSFQKVYYGYIQIVIGLTLRHKEFFRIIKCSGRQTVEFFHAT